MPAGPAPGRRPASPASGTRFGPLENPRPPRGPPPSRRRPRRSPAEPTARSSRRNSPGSTSTGPEVGRRVEPADLRIVAVDGQLGFELVDQVEGPARQVDGAGDLGPRRTSKNEPIAGRWTRSRSGGAAYARLAPGGHRLRSDARGRHLRRFRSRSRSRRLTPAAWSFHDEASRETWERRRDSITRHDTDGPRDEPAEVRRSRRRAVRDNQRKPIARAKTGGLRGVVTLRDGFPELPTWLGP